MAWPKVFGMEPTANSKLTQAMDVARGGKFLSAPNKYPSKAWYTYNDKSCGYSCQVKFCCLKNTKYLHISVKRQMNTFIGL